MAERVIAEPAERITENYLETRNKVIENCWRMIVGNDTPKREDGWLEIKKTGLLIYTTLCIKGKER